jgi:hypothetical protein
MVQKTIFAIPLCSRCAMHEISNWVYEKNFELTGEAIKAVMEELKAVKLKQGECLVCKKDVVTEGCFEGILKAFDKHKVSDNVKEEFIKLFGFAY